MKTVKILSFASMALIASTALAAAEQSTVKVGLASAFSGNVGFYGPDARKGIELAIAELEKSNPDVKYELSISDDLCTPAGGATAFRQLVNSEEVDVVIGSGCSGATLGGMPALATAQTPGITYGATNPKITEQAGVGGNAYMWRMNLNDQQIGKAFAEFIAKDGSKTAAMIGENNDFGRGAAAVYEKALPEAGVKFLGSDFFTPGTNDLRSLLGKIVADKPDALVLIGEPPDCALLARQKKELGLEAKIFSRAGCNLDETLKLMGDPNLGNGITEASYWTRTDDQPMVEEFKAKYGDYPPYNAALAYYAMMTVDQAVRLGGPSRQGINDGLAKVDWKSAIGEIKFDDHHQAAPNLFLVRVENGQSKILAKIETHQ